MQCYTELVPPTAVTHAVSLPFLRAESNNLVVAKTSLLQVFQLSTTSDEGQERLVLVGEYSLAGTVTSVARVKILESKSGGEAVLLAFKDAKLSLVEWDQENHRISTISLHFYEGENVVTPPFGPPLSDCESILAVDPSSRCAALKFGARRLAILPFRQLGDELAGEEEGEYEHDTISPTLKRSESLPQVNGEATETPYKASFTLALTELEPSISHAVDLAFLHQYRDPTFAILSASIEPSYTLLEERKDILTYTVLTLDLDKTQATSLISVPRLPSTLWKVMPLPLPVGGALLIGTNELVHIDQNGKANATAVNEFAKLESDFGMADQSHLNLKLEDCRIELLDRRTGELLIITNDGALAILSFQTLGGTVSAVNVKKATSENGNTVVLSGASCTARLDSDHVFIGSEDGVSSLLGWSRPTLSLSRKRSHAQMLDKDEDDEEEEEEEDDDDLYQSAPETKKRATSDTAINSDSPYHFAIKDELPAIGPINEACLGRPRQSKERLELAAGTGRRRASRLTLLHRDLVPEAQRTLEIEYSKAAWAIRARPRNSAAAQHDNMLFVSDNDGTKVYDIHDESDDVYTKHDAPEFESEGETIDMGTVAEGTIVVQCRPTELRTYNAALALDQIIPMTDEETDEDLNVAHISFGDPYVLIIRDDSSVQVQVVQGRELEPLEGEGLITEKKWLSGCVYSGMFTHYHPALFLLHADGALHVFSLPELRPIYAAANLPHLPPVLAADAAARRVGTKDTLTELLVTDLGQRGATVPYLVARTALDEIVLYEPFIWPQESSNDSWYSSLRFRKVPLCHNPKFNERLAEQDSRPAPLKRVTFGDYEAVSIPGAPACLLLKESSSLPRIFEVRGTGSSKQAAVLSPVHRSGCEYGFITLTPNHELQEMQLPQHTWYGTGWSVKQADLGEEVRHVAYHESRCVYVVATCREVAFYFAGEDGRHPEQDDIELRPQVPLYTIHLVSATSQKALHSIQVPYLETVTDLKVMMLEVSEDSHEQKPLVVVSTAAQRGEDMPAKGGIVVYDIIDVVPEPDVAESGFKLHQLAREQSRGAITALAGPLPGGFIGTAQGLKLMVRGLKEDGTCLPVAFLDAQSYTHTLKVLPGRGMWLAGDAWKGLWFGAFTEEPYKLTVMGKSPKSKMEVMAADFLPFDGGLYILIMDADMDLHVLQYDPENPKSVNGMRLLHRSTFHVGHFVTNSLLLPSMLKPFETQDRDLANGMNEGPDDEATKAAPSLYHVLTTSSSGSIGLVTPLDEAAYRRLSALQTHLTATLEHAAGLNPRAYRAVEAENFGGARGVVDGNLIKRLNELGAARRADVLGRAGTDAWGIRSDLEIIDGGGLAYL
ncbi:Protein cft1 [Cercospora zeina]